mgnify:CR=1 FL=1
MADVKWIKIVTDVFDDEKILLIDALPENDVIIVIWFKMLCLAGRQNNGGVFMLNDRIPYTDEMLATIFRRPVNTVRLALKTFEQFGMIEIINDTITIPNWNKHQSLDKLESAKEKNRKRVAKHREKQKALASGENECNVTVTLRNATDKNREEKEKKRKDLEGDVEEPAKADLTDSIDPADKLQIFKGCILLSDNQMGELLELMGLEIFDEYIARLQGYIEHSGRYVKNHYETLLKWYKEDTETRKRYNP